MSAEKITLQQLESFLWETAKILRGNMGASEYKDLMVGMIFLKSLSDSFEEEQEKVIKHCLSIGKTQQESKQLASEVEEYTGKFFVPECARWNQIKDLKHDIGLEINKATKKIEEYNPILKGVFVSINFNFKNKLPDKKFQDLISLFSRYRLRNNDFEDYDMMGSVLEYLIKKFALSVESYTPRDVTKLMVSLLRPKAGMRIYDPSMGTGGFLIQSRLYLTQQGENSDSLLLYGQDINQNATAICKMNMLLNGVFNPDIRTGDTLKDPLHISDGKLTTFDRVMCVPPMGLRWDNKSANSDPYARFSYGVPLNSSSDLAFIQHMISSLNSNGKIGVIVPHGILFRGRIDQIIRKEILKDDLLEAIIGVPSNIFNNTRIGTALIIINKKKIPQRRNKVLFIDAEQNYFKTKYKNILGSENIEEIVELYNEFQNYETIARVVNIEDIISNNGDLSIKSYVDNSDLAKKIHSLTKEFKDYEFTDFSNKKIINKITRLKDLENLNSNSIYLPNISNMEVILNLEEHLAKKDTKPDRYFEVHLNSYFLLAKYAHYFFKSDAGKNIFKQLGRGTTIPHISLKMIEKCKILVPPLKQQNSVIFTLSKLEKIQKILDDFASQIALNPENSDPVQDKLDSMLDNIGALSEGDNILSLIRGGENKKVEFKQTLSLDVQTFKKEKYIELSVLKTIAAFLNSDGGDLLVGVHDKGGILGLQSEIDHLYKKDPDEGILKHLRNLIIERIGAQNYTYIDYKISRVSSKKILRITCQTSETPVFVDDKDFYVRTNPATDKLEGSKVLNYIQTKFKSGNKLTIL